MIGVIFQFGNEHVEVRVEEGNCTFKTNSTFGALVPIEGLKLDKKGVIKEHPDLEGKENWREETIKRFKEKLVSYKTEKERMEYLIKDLGGYGYKPIYMQRTGFRPRRMS